MVVKLQVKLAAIATPLVFLTAVVIVPLQVTFAGSGSVTMSCARLVCGNPVTRTKVAF